MTDAKKGRESQDRIPIYIEKPSIRIDVDINLLSFDYLMGESTLETSSMDIVNAHRNEYLKVGDISPDVFPYYRSSTSIIYNAKEDLTVNQIDNLVSTILEKVQAIINNSELPDKDLIKRVVVHGSGELGKLRVLDVLKEMVRYLTDNFGLEIFTDWQPSSLRDHLAEASKNYRPYWVENMEITREIGDILDKLPQFIYGLLNEQRDRLRDALKDAQV